MPCAKPWSLLLCRANAAEIAAIDQIPHPRGKDEFAKRRERHGGNCHSLEGSKIKFIQLPKHKYGDQGAEARQSGKERYDGILHANVVRATRRVHERPELSEEIGDADQAWHGPDPRSDRRVLRRVNWHQKEIGRNGYHCNEGETNTPTLV